MDQTNDDFFELVSFTFRNSFCERKRSKEWIYEMCTKAESLLIIQTIWKIPRFPKLFQKAKQSKTIYEHLNVCYNRIFPKELLVSFIQVMKKCPNKSDLERNRPNNGMKAICSGSTWCDHWSLTRPQLLQRSLRHAHMQ